MNRSYFIVLLLFCLSANAQFMQDTIPNHFLQEVVVIAKLPLVEMQPGKTVYRMDASIAQSSGNMYEVLSSLPGVVINSDGTIMLNGKSDARILIDGKPTYFSGEELVNLLKSTPASTTDRIDLITQPTARYDAGGGSGLIDIHTKKIKLRGMNISLNGNYSQWKFGKGFGSTSLNIREDKFNFYLSYSYYKGKDINDLQIERRWTGQEDQMKQVSHREFKYTSHNYRAGFDYYATRRTTLGVSAGGNVSGNKSRGEMNTAFTYAGPLGATINNGKRSWNNFSAGATLVHRLHKDGGELDASFDYFRYKYTEKQLMCSFLPDTLKGDMGGKIDLYTGQVNFTYPLSEYVKLQTGAKTSFVTIGNSAGYARPLLSGWEQDASLGSNFSYDENINAAYVQADFERNRFKLSAGLRLEHTHIRGEQWGNSEQCDSSFTTDYVHLFPTVSMQYRLSDNHALQLSYGRRITRPNYGDLNPFMYIHDDYTYERGNTLLRPAFSDNLQLGYMFKDWLQANFFFSYMDDAIVKSYEDTEGYRIYVTTTNLSSYINTGLQINIANLPITSWWNTNLSVIGVYNRYCWLENEKTEINKKITPILNSTNQFTFDKTWTAELSGYYNGRIAFGQVLARSCGELNLAIQKKILKGNGKIGLFVKDILNTYRRDMDAILTHQQAYTKEKENKRAIGISFSYRFHKGSDVKESKRKNSIDESKRINL